MKLPKKIQDFFAKSGAKGGKARKKILTSKRRTEIARKAARVRWS